MPDETAMGGPDVRFRSTLWSVVLEARDGQRDALDRLIAAYWKPVYFFIRRRGHGVEAAKDLAQSFFARVLEKDGFKNVSRDTKFRTYLLRAVTWFLSDERDKSESLKRGGGFNFVEAESELAGTEPAPEKAFDRAWAKELMARAMKRLETEVPPDDFALLGAGGAEGLDPDAKKYRLRRLRIRLKQILRDEILATVDGEPQVESEIRDLFTAFGAAP